MTDIATHGYANPEVLVRTELVAGHRDDPLVRIARVISSGRDGFCEGDYIRVTNRSRERIQEEMTMAHEKDKPMRRRRRSSASQGPPARPSQSHEAGMGIADCCARAMRNTPELRIPELRDYHQVNRHLEAIRGFLNERLLTSRRKACPPRDGR